MIIGIIGNGFVGKATYQLQCKDINIYAYDLNPDLCKPPGTTLMDLKKCEIIFVSVPTPMNVNGSCYLKIVKSVLKDLKNIQYNNFIVLRSTIPVGTSDHLNCYFMPEFLTEKKYIQDFINNKDWIFGLLNTNRDSIFKETIRKMFSLAYKNDKIKYNNLHFVKNKEAEMIKLFRNCFLSTKVSFCNEINEFCQLHNIDYNTMIKLAANDSRILHSHSSVPGPDGKNGFGGTCFPKDISSLCYEMKQKGMKSYVLSSVIERNEKVDRPEKDWNNNKGRSVVGDICNTIMYNKTILIAGGAGFIGSNLCKRLLNENNKIICIDNLFTGKISNIRECLENPLFTYIEHDIINPLNIKEEIDEIYHLACPASPPKYQSDPIYTLKTNFIGTMNMLELAKNKKAKILLSSTSEIYGEPQITPQNELYRGNTNTVGIRSCYDEGKRISETLMSDYHRKHDVDIRIARIFNTYGPNMDIYDGRVVTNFIKQMIHNENITIYGDGSQTRSFCYIDDLLEGITRLMKSSYTKPVNIGNTDEISIRKLVYILKGLIQTRSEIIYMDLPNDDPTNRCPDIRLATKILDWTPKYILTDGLKKTIDYCMNNIF